MHEWAIGDDPALRLGSLLLGDPSLGLSHQALQFLQWSSRGVFSGRLPSKREREASGDAGDTHIFADNAAAHHDNARNSRRQRLGMLSCDRYPPGGERSEEAVAGLAIEISQETYLNA